MLARFLRDLGDSGEVTVASGPELGDVTAASEAIQEMDHIQRLSLAGAAPQLCIETAYWAASRLYRICQFIVDRDLGQELVEQELAQNPPKRRCPETDYSADLSFRYLPQALELARRLSPRDKLVELIQALGRSWPLSSVGAGDLGDLKLESFFAHPALRQLYADRIVLRKDRSRLRDPAVLASIEKSAGGFPELARFR